VKKTKETDGMTSSNFQKIRCEIIVQSFQSEESISARFFHHANTVVMGDTVTNIENFQETQKEKKRIKINNEGFVDQSDSVKLMRE